MTSFIEEVIHQRSPIETFFLHKSHLSSKQGQRVLTALATSEHLHNTMIRLDLSSNPEWWSDPIHGMRNWAILLDLIPKLLKLKHLYLTNNDLNASETLSVA